MVISRTTRESIPFVIERERELPAEQQTTFLLASLSNQTMLALLQLMQHGETKRWIEVALTAGLRGWRNFLDENGKETPFRRDAERTVTLHGVEIKGPVSKGSLPTRS
jgi:hypothetical protein